MIVNEIYHKYSYQTTFNILYKSFISIVLMYKNNLAKYFPWLFFIPVGIFWRCPEVSGDVWKVKILLQFSTKSRKSNGQKLTK